MIIIIKTHSKKSKQAKTSFAKHNPATKYAVEKMRRSKSDIFVVCE